MDLQINDVVFANAIAATITILLSIFVVGLALWQFRATKSFKTTTWRRGSNMAKSPSIKREKWIRLSLTWLVVLFVSTIIIYPLVRRWGVSERREQSAEYVDYS